MVWPEAFAARERGILFDVGHGVGSFTWRVARAALAQGFPPDTISSDIHAHNHAGPVHDLPRTLSKLLHLGMPLQDVIAAATVARRQSTWRTSPRPAWGRSRRARRATSACSSSSAGSFALIDGEHRLSAGVTEHAERAPRGAPASCARAPSSPATSRRDGPAHRGRPRRDARTACSTVPMSWWRTAASPPSARPRPVRRELDARGCYVLPGRLRSACARLRGTRRDAPAAALRSGTHGGRGLRAARAGRARGGRVRALARACHRMRPAASSRSRRSTSPLRSTRPRSQRSPRRACAASSSSSPIASSAWTPATTACCVRSNGAASMASCRACTARTQARSRSLRERLRAAGDLGVDAHPRSRPPLVEEEGIRRALDLARLAEAPVYIVHVSTAGGVAAIRRARAEGLDVTGETCPQYLLLDDGVYAGPLCPDGRDLAAAAPARTRRGRLGGRARRDAERDRLGSLAPRLAPVPPRSTSSSRAAPGSRRACR